MAAPRGAMVFGAFFYFVSAFRLVYCGNELFFSDGRFRSYYYQVYENVGSVNVCVSSAAEMELRAYFHGRYYYSSDTTSAKDILFPNHTFSVNPLYNFTMAPGEKRCFEVTIIDDNIAEREHSLGLNLGYYVGNTSDMRDCGLRYIYVHDNDGLAFEQFPYTYDEGAGAVQLCVAYRGENVDQTIEANISPRFSTQNDVIFSAKNVTMSRGDRICLDVVIVDDNNIEYTESFFFHVMLRNGSYISNYYQKYTDITVIDNDAFRFGFEMSAYTVAESDGEVEVCVTADRGDGSDIYSATISSINITAQGVLDYVEIEQDVIISAANNRQCFNISITDDTLLEENEYFELTLTNIRNRVSNTYIHQIPIQVANITVLDDDGQPLLLECAVTGSSGHIVVDCQTNRKIVSTVCSFDNGLNHTCTYPIAINLAVSPPGNHTLTITVEDDRGFVTQNTVPYFLGSDLVTTDAPQVPPLLVQFINNSPRLTTNSVEVDIALSRPVQSLWCVLKGRSTSTAVNCASRHAEFSNLSAGPYTLRVEAKNQVPDRELLRRSFEVTDDPKRCTVHLINSGVSVEGDVVTVEFASNGPVQKFSCKLDREDYYDCSNPVTLTGLTAGNHQLRVVPVGCGRNRRILKAQFNVTSK